LLNFLSGLTSVLGLIIALIFGNVAETFSLWILPIAAGGFIYIAMTDLIPELKEFKKIKHSILQILTILSGILIMILMLFLE
jgi:zinc and cadmium transporter